MAKKEKWPDHPYHRQQKFLVGSYVPGFSEGNDKMEKKALGKAVRNK